MWIGMMQSGLDLAIDLTFEKEEAEALKAGASGVAAVAGFLTGDIATGVKASAETASSAAKVTAHALGAEYQELDYALDMAGQLGGQLLSGASPMQVLGEAAIEAGAGAALGWTLSEFTDGEFTVLDGMSMTQGMGSGVLGPNAGERLQEIGVDALAMAAGGGIGAALSEDDRVGGMKFGMQIGRKTATTARATTNWVSGLLNENEGAKAGEISQREEGSGKTEGGTEGEARAKAAKAKAKAADQAKKARAAQDAAAEKAFTEWAEIAVGVASLAAMDFGSEPRLEKLQSAWAVGSAAKGLSQAGLGQGPAVQRWVAGASSIAEGVLAIQAYRASEDARTMAMFIESDPAVYEQAVVESDQAQEAARRHQALRSFSHGVRAA